MMELLNSMVRLSAAVTVYSMQEVQEAVDSVNPQESIDKLREMIDSVASAVTAKIDESRRPTLESFSKLGKDVVGRTQDAVDRTMETLKVPVSAHGIVQGTTDAARSASDWLDGIVKPRHTRAAEPREAEDVLSVS